MNALFLEVLNVLVGLGFAKPSTRLALVCKGVLARQSYLNEVSVECLPFYCGLGIPRIALLAYNWHRDRTLFHQLERLSCKEDLLAAALVGEHPKLMQRHSDLEHMLGIALKFGKVGYLCDYVAANYNYHFTFQTVLEVLCKLPPVQVEPALLFRFRRTNRVSLQVNQLWTNSL
jgi:hypothetical protein